MAAGLVPSGAFSSHYGINRHVHRIQILPIQLINCAITPPSQSFFGQYRHRNLAAAWYPSSSRQKSNAAINHPTAAAAAAAAAAQQVKDLSQEEYSSIDDILNQVQRHSSLFHDDNSNESITLSGTGIQLGMDAIWTLTIRSDGAFREDVSSPFVTFSSGFNADFTNNTAAWDVDSSGVCHSLQLDDHQATVLVAWIRSGVWTLPWLRKHLDIEFVDTFTTNTNNKENNGKENTNKEGDCVTLAVRLQSGRVAIQVKINTATWHPESAKVIMCGDSETWEFQNWKHWELTDEVNKTTTSVPCSEKLIHHSMNGGSQSLTITNIQRASTSGIPITTSNTNDKKCHYSIPHSISEALLPLDSRFLKDVSSAVPVWHTRSGHMLAFATLNGDSTNSGYFIVDTGASGFVIEPTAADKLNLESFGEVHVTGMAGKIKGKFRRAEVFQLGPLEVKDAVMMEMNCGGLVTGAPGPVVGIVGFDVFRRAVVDIPPMLPRKSAAVIEEEKERASIVSPAAALAFAAMQKQKTSTTTTTSTPKPHAHIHLHHPEESDDMLRSMLRPEDWLPVTMLSCLPHIPVKIQSTLSSSDDGDTTTAVNDNTNSSTALLMVDTGAGGMAAMLNSSAAKTLGLFDNKSNKSKSIRGVGGSHNHSVTLKTAELGVLKVGSAEFNQVQCLIAGEDRGGVALSFYSSGILCGDILSQCRLVIDLARGRMAVLPAETV